MTTHLSGPGVGRAPHHFLDGSQIATLTGEFLADLDDNDRLAIGVSCSADGLCQKQFSGKDLPARAWRMMANSALYQSLKDLRYREKAEADFNELAKQWNTESELFSLHQLETAYNLLEEEQYLFAYVKGMEFLGLHSRQRYSETEAPAFSDIMFMATAARQHATFARLLRKLSKTKDRETLAILQNKRLVPNDLEKLKDYQDFHHTQAERILKTAAKSTANLSDEAEHDAAQCWLRWAEVPTYQNTEPQKLKELPIFFKDLSRKLKRKQGNIAGLQSLLICASTLKELATTSPKLRKTYHEIMQQIISGAWDSPENIKCTGSNGFNSDYSGSTSTTCTIQDISSASLIAYLLADDKYQYRIR